MAAAAASVVNVSLGGIANFTSLQIDSSAVADASEALSFDTLVNQGEINVAVGESLVVGLVASGANGGIIDLHSGGLVDFEGAVAAQTIDFNPALSPDATGGTLVTETQGQPPPRAFDGNGTSDILFQNTNGNLASG